ncbi:cysteine serine-rich nuclear 3 [Brachionus plicatilis]|uniref:Cysteine serine-rich nuclear 3 n=1 Tax=Brachionus plicatilis TaxID=10195 RepID=A0A3M7R5U7_BRAPC|nr:cysteine serine-rich nuclear 3 [Brachionus plicatilis]
MNENVNNHVQDETQNIQIKSSIKTESCNKREKKSVKFNKVDVYHFDRCQGYLSIPGSENHQNSITLGMEYFHNDYDSFLTQEEFLKFKRKLDLDRIQNFLNSTDSNELSPLNDEIIDRAKEVLSKRDYYEENIEQDLAISADILCPILTVEQRIEKLIDMGYDRDEIDIKESEDINLIRKSRLICGCSCSKMNMVCGENGDLCSCFANGISCQIDRIKFPCSCSLKRCKNLNGMKRFNPKMLHGKNEDNEDEPKPKRRKRKGANAKPPAKRKKIIHQKIENDIYSTISISSRLFNRINQNFRFNSILFIKKYIKKNKKSFLYWIPIDVLVSYFVWDFEQKNLPTKINNNSATPRGFYIE